MPFTTTVFVIVDFQPAPRPVIWKALVVADAPFAIDPADEVHDAPGLLTVAQLTETEYAPPLVFVTAAPAAVSNVIFPV